MLLDFFLVVFILFHNIELSYLDLFSGAQSVWTVEDADCISAEG